jgi:hypothetical protein
MEQARDLHTIFPELVAFEAEARKDAAVLGVLYTGSLARGDFDRFSDLDIKLWLADDWPPGQDRLRELLGWLGEVQYICIHGEDGVTGGVGPHWRRTDLDLIRATELKPEPWLRTARVVKDTEGVLARLVAKSPPEAIQATLEQARELMETMIDSQIYLALHNARGAVWSAMGEVSGECSELYTLLARLRGRNSYGFRYVELLLSPEEQALMRAAWPVAPDQAEVRRAARALWDWARHVGVAAERELSASLDLEIDEAGLLAAVDRIYGW